tara:strand:+ start:3444 stop:3908 length:465 start_codon:yes stop_codon:yes gene_type:complete
MSYFVHKHDETVVIDNEVFPLHLVQRVVPAYTLPPNMTKRKYSQEESIHYISSGTNIIKQEYPWDIAEQVISNLSHIKFMKQQIEDMEQEEEEQRKAAAELNRAYEDRRKEEYPDTDAMVVAMWEYLVENRREDVDKLQELRKTIKLRHPKRDK